jgi:hypothetical protein
VFVRQEVAREAQERSDETDSRGPEQSHRAWTFNPVLIASSEVAIESEPKNRKTGLILQNLSQIQKALDNIRVSFPIAV